MNPYIIAIDFDGTICADGWPYVSKGKLINSTYEKMLKQIELNPATSFVLWTCRDGDLLEEAVDWCLDNKLPIYYFNENHPSTKEWLVGGNSKIFANEYWDDRAVKI